MLLLLSFCAGSNYKSEFQFANKLAEKGLWEEAYMRWQKVLDSGQDSAELRNNIAIALENMGKLEEAEKSYKKALAMKPKHRQIKTNHERLQKLLRMEKRSQEREEKKSDKRKMKRRTA